MSNVPQSQKILKRDLRDSSLRFGCWITTYNWKDVYEIAECDRKFNKFNEILSNMIHYFFPIKSSKVRSSDKLWNDRKPIILTRFINGKTQIRVDGGKKLNLLVLYRHK